MVGATAPQENGMSLILVSELPRYLLSRKFDKANRHGGHSIRARK
jgi:hypothetical protein